MLVVMQSHATPEQVEQVAAAVRRMGLTPHPLPGALRTAVGITGNVGAVDPRALEVLLGVMELHLAGRQWFMEDEYTIADIAMLGWVRNLVGFYGAREIVEFDALTHVFAIDADTDVELALSHDRPGRLLL